MIGTLAIRDLRLRGYCDEVDMLKVAESAEHVLNKCHFTKNIGLIVCLPSNTHPTAPMRKSLNSEQLFPSLKILPQNFEIPEGLQRSS